MMKTKIKTFGRKVNYGVQIVAVGALTGALAGLIVTLYNMLVEFAEHFSVGCYNVLRMYPAFIPLLFVALFLGAIIVGGFCKFIPLIRGSGFPQTEGATQGLIHFKWYKVLTGMFAASLMVVFMGLSAGAEGPSLMIGGACGYGVSDVTRRNASIRRYQITGGASAGLAVVLNAPLTGMVFAYEEAHKRFTPEVFVCSFSSVLTAITVRDLLVAAMGMEVGPFLEGFTFTANAGIPFLLYALGAALVVSLVAVGYYFLLFFARKKFRKLNFWKGLGKYTIPFLLAGVCGLVTGYVMGGGVEFIEALSSASEHTVSVFGAPLIVSLLIIIALKFITTLVNIGCELPCCGSLPMMAMGAGIGAAMSLLFQMWGMDPALSDGLIVICMVTFFTTVVKAPLTGILMTIELTWNFTYLLPAVVAVAVGYIIGDAFRTEPMHERILEEIIEEQRAPLKRLTVLVRVTAAAGRNIRDILWPFSALVTNVSRGEARIIPEGDANLHAGDILTVEGAPNDREDYLGTLTAIVGEILEVREESAEEEVEIAPEAKAS